MRIALVALSLGLAILAPLAAQAGIVDPNFIPDGRYVVKVEKVNDAHHMLVLMDNGIETVLVGRDNVDFSSLKPNDKVRVALIKGTVPVFAPT